MSKLSAMSLALVWAVLLSAGLNTLRADEPPIHPRNSTWNSYTDSRQFSPNWSSKGAVCPTCAVPEQRFCLPGWRGQPYADKVLGCENCRHNQNYSACRSCWDCPDSSNRHWSIHWPRPFSNFWDQHFPGQCCDHAFHRSGMGTRKSCGHFFDCLQPLSDIKLLESPRRDSGYCGPECDPYGKLGASGYPKFTENAAGKTSNPTGPHQGQPVAPDGLAPEALQLSRQPFSRTQSRPVAHAQLLQERTTNRIQQVRYQQNAASMPNEYFRKALNAGPYRPVNQVPRAQRSPTSNSQRPSRPPESDRLSRPTYPLPAVHSPRPFGLPAPIR